MHNKNICIQGITELEGTLEIFCLFAQLTAYPRADGSSGISVLKYVFHFL